MQSGVPLRLNIPFERHASKIYTRSMFEQFSEALYKSFAHEVDVIEHQKVYKVTHLDAEAREKWSKVVFIVNGDDEASFFDCECGTFEHSGMVYCHSLKVIGRNDSMHKFGMINFVAGITLDRSLMFCLLIRR